MLDSGAGGADVMMNLSSGTDLDLLDPKRNSSISTTVRVHFPCLCRKLIVSIHTTARRSIQSSNEALPMARLLLLALGSSWSDQSAPDQ